MLYISLTSINEYGKKKSIAGTTNEFSYYIGLGYVMIPKGMELPKSYPYVEIEHTDGIVTKLTSLPVPNPEPPDPIEPEPEPEPDPTPTTEERVTTLESDNDLLKQQLKAASDQNDFLEDCIAEMAAIVYA